MASFLDATAATGERFVCNTGGEGVNLRSEPSTISEVITSLIDSTSVVYNGEVRGEFVKVKVDESNESGWVKAAYLCTSRPAVRSGAYSSQCASNAVTAKLPVSGEGLRTYGYDELVYGTCTTVERLKELGRRVQAKTGLPIFVGDLSAYGGGNLGRHATHRYGDDVDIAIMGNTDGTNCFTYNTSCYNREASRTLIREIIAMGGVTRILFNDPVLAAEFPRVIGYASGHDNHYHVEWHN
jgi:hypothetical protein